jgi:hypothetical protein
MKPIYRPHTLARRKTGIVIQVHNFGSRPSVTHVTHYIYKREEKYFNGYFS